MKPPNAPLLITRITSPGCARDTTRCTRSPTSGDASASIPFARSSSTTLPMSSCSSSGTLSCGSGTRIEASDAPSNALAYSRWWMLRRLVLERGSNTAHSRRSG